MPKTHNVSSIPMFFLFLFPVVCPPTLAFVTPVSIAIPRKENAFACQLHHELLSATITTSITPILLDPPTDLSLASNTLLAAGTSTTSFSGTLFQVSLLPYLAFLYFLGFRANRLPDLANFGFQFVLVFVFAAIPAGSLCQSKYGLSLSNVDWIHGGAESLLTIANVLIVLGLKETINNPTKPFDWSVLKPFAFGAVVAFAIMCAVGTSPLLGTDAHAAFLLGLGNLPTTTNSEPANALSIPTWIIHYSSMWEYIAAMWLVWNYSKTTGNSSWKGLVWGMLPLHAGGICACTNHLFYNSQPFLVLLQGWLTLIGNTTCALAAWRIAQSNGWTPGLALSSSPKSNTDPAGLVADAIATQPLLQTRDIIDESNSLLVAKFAILVLICSYATKYGSAELATSGLLDLDSSVLSSSLAALALVFGIPSITASYYWNLSSSEK